MATSRITHVNPPELHANPAFSQATIAEAGRTLYIGGQNGTDAQGVIEGGIAEQTARAIGNLQTILAHAGAGPDDIARLTVYLVAGVDPGEAYGAAVSAWGVHPTAVTVLRVAGLGRPEALVEIDAIAAL